ncbi:MAG: L-aspartate oxidase [Spirochaetales bacterium]|nr:L-aspartate oxidase [Spirochaetales bacterium]
MENMYDAYDAVIIGTGIAGLTCGINLKEAGKKVLLITKESAISDTNTHHAQGGIIAWRKDDTAESLEKDILEAGCEYNNSSAVRELSENGPRLVIDFLIDHTGTRFDHNDAGELDYTEEAAHTHRRIVHYQDLTGEEIQRSLTAYAEKTGLQILTNTTAVDLVTNNHHSLDTQELYAVREVMGVYALDNSSGNVRKIPAHNVILATGGIGNLYQHTTNPKSATGDGIAMAYRAGADIINAEFVQFHPTALFHRDIKRFLISESLRGEGAKLLDSKGRRFMQDYSKLQDLAPRDVVARSIYNKMGEDGSEHVLLDLASHYTGTEPIEKRFSKIYSTCLEGGIDITREPIPVVPAAHYFCGGIKVDVSGATSIGNLFAIGEVSCTGLHGANRLASTSLLEGLLWGKNCADSIIRSRNRITAGRFDAIPDWSTPESGTEFDPLLLKQDWQEIKMTMWNYAGIVRTSRGLKRARADLSYFSHRIFDFYQSSAMNKEIIELRNAVICAGIIVNAALHNTRPIGCHYIADR